MRKTLLSTFGAIATISLLLCTSAMAAPRTCRFVLRLADAVDLGSLQLDVNYFGAPGSFALNDQAKVDCSGDVLTATALFNDDTDTSHLSASFISIEGFSGPATIGHCTFTDDSGTLVPEDFSVSVVDAADPQGAPLGSPPDIQVKLPDCSTSDTSTTTTNPVTTTEPPQTFCDVTLRMTTTATITSIDWQLDYQNAPGEFNGSGGSVSCTNLRPGSLASFNDIENSHTLLGGLIHLQGFAAPADIARCVFLPSGPDVPIASDFLLLVKQATDKNANVIDPTPKMKVSKIECRTPATSTTTTLPDCGDGQPQSGEQCDDGNQSNTDACLNDCSSATCGDGFQRAGVETCDDGNTLSRDGCSATCTKDTICGDANLSSSVTASDALAILKFAVGSLATCPAYVCDTNDNGQILASDALSALKRAVSAAFVLTCPPEPD